MEYVALYVDRLALEGLFFLWYVWFCICPPGQRPFGSEANISVSELCKQKLSSAKFCPATTLGLLILGVSTVSAVPTTPR